MINFCGDCDTSIMYAENNPSLCSSERVVKILSHDLKSFEKLGNGIVGPASNALFMTSFFQTSDIKKNSIILFFKIGFLRKVWKTGQVNYDISSKIFFYHTI